MPVIGGSPGTSGQLEVESVTVEPEHVVPGGTVTLAVTVRENADIITPGDPSLCNPEGSASSGLECEVHAVPDHDWPVPNETIVQCVPMWISTIGREEFTIRFDAPTEASLGEGEEWPKQHSLAVRMTHLRPESPGSDDTVDPTVWEMGFDVSPDGEQGCSINADCPTGYVCSNGSCIPEDDAEGGGDDDGLFGAVGDIGNAIIWGIGGLVAYKGLDTASNITEQPEAGELPERERVLREQSGGPFDDVFSGGAADDDDYWDDDREDGEGEDDREEGGKP